MKIRGIFFLIVISFVTLPNFLFSLDYEIEFSIACSYLDENDRIRKWVDDISEYVRVLEAEENGGLYHAVAKEEFNRSKNTLISRIGELSDMQIFIELCKLNALTGIAHNFIFPRYPLNLFPFKLRFFDEGYVVIAIDKQYQEALGKILVAINGCNIDTIINSLVPLISRDVVFDVNGNKSINPQWFCINLPVLLQNVSLLHSMGFINNINSIILTFKDENDHQFSIEMQSIFLQSGGDIKLTLPNWYFCDFGNNDSLDWKEFQQIKEDLYDKKYFFKKLSDDVLYVQYNECQEDANYPISQFVKDIKKCIDTNLIKTFVMDVRNNLGGDSEVIKPLTLTVSNAVKTKKIDTLFCIIGNGTFSSGFLCALDFQKLGAIMVGGSTSQPYNVYGDCKMHTLLNSKIMFQYSTKYFLMDESKRHDVGLFPDITVAERFQDYIKAKDSVLAVIGRAVKTQLDSVKMNIFNR